MVRTLTLSLIVLAASGAAVAQTSLLDQTIKSGAFAESITAYCTQKNAKGGPQYQTALDGWRQRNEWSAIRPKARPGQFEAATDQAGKAIQNQGLKALVLCLDLNKTLTTATFDPSQQHAQELAQLAGGPAQGRGPVQQQAPPPVQTAPQQAPLQAAPVIPGGQGQVGDATFSLPGTWKAAKTTPNEALFQRPVEDHGAVNIFALEQKPIQGDFKSSFAAIVRGMFPGKTPQLKYIYEAKTRTSLPALYVRDGSQIMASGRSKSAAIRAVGVQAPNHQIFVIMLMSTDGFKGKADSEKELTSVVSSLVFRTQSIQHPWDPLVNHGNGNASAVYWYATITNMPNAFGGMDTRAERKYVVLLPGGRAYRDLPEGGHVTDMDFESACRDPKRMDNCGSYNIEGSMIRTRFPEDFGLMADSLGPYQPGRMLKSNEHEYSYIAPVKSDLKLNGRYSSFWASVGSTAYSSNSVSSEKFITFAADGRYLKQGFSSASFANSGAGGTVGGRKAPSQGTYQINGYTLLLRPQGGAPESYTVIFEEQSAHPKAVFIDDEGYLAK